MELGMLREILVEPARARKNTGSARDAGSGIKNGSKGIKRMENMFDRRQGEGIIMCASGEELADDTGAELDGAGEGI